MAETMSDKEIREELMSFGEQNIGPITSTTRALYVKKLNHYRARAKVPAKKGSSAVVSKKLLGFSSDESGDEAGPSRPSSRRRGRAAKTPVKSPPEPRAPIPTYDSVPRRIQKTTTELRRRPLRPASRRGQQTDEQEEEDEEDTMAPSQYVSPSTSSAAAMQSFNVQTSLNTTFTVDDTVDSSLMPTHEAFDSSDSDFDPLSPPKEDDSQNSDFAFPRTSTQYDSNNKPPPPGRRAFPSSTTSHTMSSPYPHRTSDQMTAMPILQPSPARPSSHSRSVPQPAETPWAHYISMFLVVLACLFFVCLAFMYLTMKSSVSDEDTAGKLCSTILFLLMIN